MPVDSTNITVGDRRIVMMLCYESYDKTGLAH